MTKIETIEQYEWAMDRVEQLLPLVDDDTPASNPYRIELELLSNLVGDYSDIHFAISNPPDEEGVKSFYAYDYPRPAVTADCVVMTNEPFPKVLLIQRGNDPYKGLWAFPGGFMNMDETTEQCAIRELEEETNMKVNNFSLIGVYSKVDRDPRGRTITVAYLAIIDSPEAVNGQDDAAKAEWFSITNLPKLAFDHNVIMRDAIKAYNQSEKKQSKIVLGKEWLQNSVIIECGK